MQHLESLDARTHFDAGQLDTHFGTSGLTEITVPYSSPSKEPYLRPLQSATDAAGRTIVAAFSNTRVTFRRLDAFGAPDTRFAESALGQTSNYSGGPTSADNGFDFAVDPSNRIYVLNGATVTRYTSSGKIDQTFGRRGRVDVKTAIDRPNEVQVGADGHVWVAGTASLSSTGSLHATVVRYTADGAPDAAFANKGIYNTPLPVLSGTTAKVSVKGEALRLLADGSAVLAGSGGAFVSSSGGSSGYEKAVTQAVKLDSAGKLDTSYGTRGVAAYSAGSDVNAATTSVLGVRGDGTVVIGVSSASRDSEDPISSVIRAGITAAGQVDSHQYRTLATMTQGEFVPGGDGSDYFVNPDGLTKFAADSANVDTSFNRGQTIAGITTTTLANSGELTFAGTGRKANDARFNVGRYYTNDGPSATVIAGAASAAARYLSFTVLYTDDDGVNADELNGQELRVRGPNYYARPTMLGYTSRKGVITATYRLVAADGRGFTAANNGLYAVSLVNGRPHDIDGNAAVARTIGTLVVNVA